MQVARGDRLGSEADRNRAVNAQRARCSLRTATGMGKVTGFLEYERNDRDYAPVEERIKHWREFVLPLPEEENTRPGGALHGLRHPLTATRPAADRLRSTTRSRTGTTSSIAATGRRPRATCTRPTISRRSPAASARRRARRPARSTSTTTRSPSRPSNARSPTAPSRRAGSSRSRRRRKTGKRVAVVGSGPAGHGLRAAARARRPRRACLREDTPRPAACCATAFPTSRWRSTIVDRRVAQMEAEGVTFHYSAHVGVNVAGGRAARRTTTRWCSPAAPRSARDLPIPGRELKGIHFAMDFLPQQNRRVSGEPRRRRRADPRRRQARRRDRRRRHRLRLHRHLDPPGRAVGDQFRDHAAAARSRRTSC